jgi:hypothetical protein
MLVIPNYIKFLQKINKNEQKKLYKYYLCATIYIKFNYIEK